MSKVVVIRPSDRASWLAARARDVTASVVGALFGEHEFTTIYQLWALKTGRDRRDDEETPAIRRGRLLEQVAVQLLREQYPSWTITHNAAENIYFRDPEARLGATPDVIVDAPGRGKGVVQVKSVEASAFRRKWLDEDGNVEAPLWIALQATLEAHLTGCQWAAVAPLVVSHGLEMPLIDIPILPGVIEAIVDRTRAFWAMVEEGREPEPDYARDGAVIERIYAGDASHEVDLTADNRVPTLIAERRERMAERDGAQGRINEIDAEIKAKMGDAYVAHIAGGRKITWKPQARAGFFVEPKTTRALRYPIPEKD